MFVLYNFLLTLLSPIWVPWMIWRARKRQPPVNWKERQGIYRLPPRGDKRRIWLHAVSVGEIMAALPVLRELRAILPTHDIVLSVTTSSGHQTAQDRAAGLYDHLVYFPIDVARFQLAAMQQVRPDAVAIMETELWMNFLWAAKTFGARTLVINGRISDRSFPLAKKFTFFYKALLANVDRCLMQTAADAERIRELGAREPEVFGNAKFDQANDAQVADPKEWKRTLGIEPNHPVVVVGSIRGEEFEFLATALTPELARMAYWIIAPRHLERTDELAKALDAHKVLRRSKGEKIESHEIMILDTYGELSSVYSIADLAIIGGGFKDLGGQNLIQPLALGVPVIHGQYMKNFRDSAEMAAAKGASREVGTASELSEAVQELLTNVALRGAMGQSATELVRENLGASKLYAQAIADEAKSAQSADRRK